MNRTEKIKLLATEVMGWKQYNGDDDIAPHFLTELGTPIFCFNPFESWADCGMLIEKCVDFHGIQFATYYDYMHSKWAAARWDEDGKEKPVWIEDESLLVASCEAIGKHRELW